MQDLTNLKQSELYDRFAPKPDLWERRFYYFFSLHLLRLLYRSRISPDQVSALSLFTGLGAAALLCPTLAREWNLVGVFLLNLSNVFDALDGQLARARRQFSPLGWLWDVVIDQLKILLTVLALILWSGQPAATTTGWALLAILGLKHFFHYFLEHRGAERIWDRSTAAPSPLARAVHRLCLAIDSLFFRLRLGLLTVGEFYLVISAGVLLRSVPAALLLLALYAAFGLVFIIVYHAARLSVLQPRLSQLVADRTRVWIFGAGQAGQGLLAGLRRRGLEAERFLDNNPALAGSAVAGLEVHTPETFRGRWPEGVVVLVASVARHQIAQQLSELGLPNERVVVL